MFLHMHKCYCYHGDIIISISTIFYITHWFCDNVLRWPQVYGLHSPTCWAVVWLIGWWLTNLRDIERSWLGVDENPPNVKTMWFTTRVDLKANTNIGSISFISNNENVTLASLELYMLQLRLVWDDLLTGHVTRFQCANH